MKTKTQDPKFYIENGKLIGRSGVVPDDEPLFILRGRDLSAIPTLISYVEHAKNAGAMPEHVAAIEKRIEAFKGFANQNEDRMKIPDTSIRELHDGRPTQ